MSSNALLLVVISAAFAAGWWVNGLRHDSVALAVERAAQANRTAQLESERRISANVEEQLARQRANERIIHTVEREIVERPVYRTECIDDDGLQLIRRYAAGPYSAEPVNPASPRAAE